VRAAVLAPQAEEAEEVLLRRCRECGVEPRRAGGDIEVVSVDEEGRLLVSLCTERADYGTLRLALRGRHQLANASVAVALAEALAAEGFPFGPPSIVKGLETAEHAGRLELDAGRVPPLLYDGAHNPAGALALRRYLDEFVAPPVTLVFGAMRDKALAEIGAALFPAAARLVLTSPDHPRAASVEELLSAVPVPASSSTISLAPSSADAIRLALAQTPPGGTVCVTGSLYLVGEVKDFLSKTV
jgi:dihydrofolate synthase/folylpolyglutamate synthase